MSRCQLFFTLLKLVEFAIADETRRKNNYCFKVLITYGILLKTLIRRYFQKKCTIWLNIFLNFTLTQKLIYNHSILSPWPSITRC